jgi:serine/threonine-protein kinase
MSAVHLALSAFHLGTDLVGRYQLERLIGEGASSWVFAAHDLRLEREVAVKLLKRRAEPEHTAQRLRFVHEGRMLAKLAHPHVVAVHDAGETPEGDGYLVMELSPAGSLEAELARRVSLGLEETLQLLFPLLGALACAHDRGIVHRDLKPANIALVHEGGKTRAKLLDFGIAKHADLALSSGGVVGTPAYMAPEQARAEGIGPGTDVWAAGVVLFRCLSGKLPFEASSSAALLLKLVQERAAPIGSVCPGLPPRVAVAIDRALEPDPRHRYPDMRTFARVLGLACRQDGLPIETQPEPIGLPDFASWLQQADVEATHPQREATQVSPVRAVASVAVSPSSWRSGRKPVVLWAAVLASVLAGAVWATISPFVPAAGQLSPAAAPGPLGSYPRQPLPAALELRRVSTIEPEHAPAAVGQAQPPALTPRREKLRLKLGRAKSEIGQVPTISLSEHAPTASGADLKQHGLITNWEW